MTAEQQQKLWCLMMYDFCCNIFVVTFKNNPAAYGHVECAPLCHILSHTGPGLQIQKVVSQKELSARSSDAFFFDARAFDSSSQTTKPYLGPKRQSAVFGPSLHGAALKHSGSTHAVLTVACSLLQVHSTTIVSHSTSRPQRDASSKVDH